jgi:uncharacterized protein YprB with RNaseH-like and TPR domain
LQKSPKILIWDIEASNLVADYGWVLCISYKWFGRGKPKTIRIRGTREFKRDRTDDSGVLKKFAKVFADADVHVFWFGEYFDLPFVQTRLLIAGEKPLPTIPFIDGWRIARKKLKLRSNRLDAVSKILHLNKGEKREEKLQPTPEDWRRANAGHHDALKIIEERCESDVLVLEQIYSKIRHLGSNLPNLSKFNDEQGCPACGSEKVNRRGFNLTPQGKRQRMQCQQCAHWFSLAYKLR